MKFLLILLSLTIAQKSCNQSKINQEVISIEYTAASRGFYKQVLINKANVLVSNKRNEEPIKQNYNADIWEKIIKVLNKVDVKTISNLEAPSKAFQYDGAAITRLKIIYDGKTYETPPFDHGNPPKEIEEVVKEILSISENIE